MKVSMHNKQARRDRAKARFSILTLVEYQFSRAGGDKEDYARYVARKNEERIALGVTNSELQVR